MARLSLHPSKRITFSSLEMPNKGPNSFLCSFQSVKIRKKHIYVLVLGICVDSDDTSTLMNVFIL